MHECVTYDSLQFQVSLVSNQYHWEVIPVLNSQDLRVKFLDLVVTVEEFSHSILSKNDYVQIIDLQQTSFSNALGQYSGIFVHFYMML